MLIQSNPATLPTPMGYSQVVASAGSRTIFVSGQVSVDREGNVVAPGNTPGQARQAFVNLGLALEAVGASITDVAKITWYIVGYQPEMLPELAAARASVFGAHKPASTLLGVQSLARPEYLVEVEATAVTDRPTTFPSA